MKYKTTIEVLTDADNKDEAADIAGEYLRGDISEGADLRVKTLSLSRLRRNMVILVVCSALGILFTILATNRISYKIATGRKESVASYAIQPSLKTNMSESQGREFKKIWEEEHKKRIESITR